MNRCSDQKVSRIGGGYIHQVEGRAIRGNLDVEIETAARSAAQVCRAATIGSQGQNRKCVAGRGRVATPGTMTGRRGIGRHAFGVERERDQGRGNAATTLTVDSCLPFSG